MPLFSDLQPMLDIKSMLGTKPIPDITLLTFCIQLEVLLVLEPSGLDFQLLSSIL